MNGHYESVKPPLSLGCSSSFWLEKLDIRRQKPAPSQARDGDTAAQPANCYNSCFRVFPFRLHSMVFCSPKKRGVEPYQDRGRGM
jgi:hypothetical protein